MKLHEDVSHKTTIKRFKTLEEDFRKVHADRYDYSKVVFKKVKDKVIINCPKHGDFEQTPNSHLNGQGCANCSNNKRSSREEFIKKATKVHENKYNYDKVIYKGANNKVTITCHIHGDFEQVPAGHLIGKGCCDCGFEKQRNNNRNTTEEFVSKAKEIHGDKYDYSRAVYKRAITKVIITCPFHGDFLQTPNNHLSGSGCPNCANENKGWTRDKYKDIHVILYYLKVEKENYPTVYKIGITSRSVNERYLTESNSIKITTLNEIIYEDGALAFDEEQRILKEFKRFKYKGEKIFKYGGNTELFVEDILGLDS